MSITINQIQQNQLELICPINCLHQLTLGGNLVKSSSWWHDMDCEPWTGWDFFLLLSFNSKGVGLKSLQGFFNGLGCNPQKTKWCCFKLQKTRLKGLVVAAASWPPLQALLAPACLNSAWRCLGCVTKRPFVVKVDGRAMG